MCVRCQSDLEVGVKNRASLLKNLTRFDRYSKICLARLGSEPAETLKCSEMDDLARTSRQIARVQLNMMKLSRELKSVFHQIRDVVVGGASCGATPAATVADQHAANGCNPSDTDAGPRFAFTAVMTENGAVVARVLEQTHGMWPHHEYGCFETWTQAQEFATVLNQSYGSDPIEAQHIVISSSLAARSSEQGS